MLDEKDEKFRELQEKLDDIDARIDELEESGESVEPEEGFLQIHNSSNQFFLHWIDITETNFSNCDSVDSVEKAQTAFKEASEYRDNPQNDKRELMHGDIMVLLCNTSKEDDGEGNITYPDACYYVGMCVTTDGLMQDKNPVTGIKIASSTVDGTETLKQFIAWDTCGSGEAVDTEGHTGDVIESVLGTPTHTATCSGDQTILNITFPVTEKTLAFEDGLLKTVSSPTQGTPITSTIYLPCCCDDTPMCGNCPGVTAADVSFSTIKEYAYYTTGQATCPNNPNNITINGNCWTFIREVEYSNWSISSNNCAGSYNNFTTVSGQTLSAGNFDVMVTQNPCGKSIQIDQISGASFDLSTFPASEYVDGNKQNPANLDQLYIFS